MSTKSMLRVVLISGFKPQKVSRQWNKLACKVKLMSIRSTLKAIELQGMKGCKLLNRSMPKVIDTNIQDMKGKQAIEQLKQSGWNDCELQALKDSGLLKQIGAQGDIERTCKNSRTQVLLIKSRHKVMWMQDRCTGQR